jgi:pyrroline-5-carboxylate reductase
VPSAPAALRSGAVTKLTVIGGGKMGEALVGGLIDAEWAPPDEITVVEPVEARREELAKTYEGLAVVEAAASLDDVLVAVKPNHCEAVCSAIAPLGPRRILSIAAGVTTASLETWLPVGTRVVRAMPNTPALVGAGMAAISAGTHADSDDLGWAGAILSSVGEVVVLAESAMDAVTGVSGSGPAYLFLLAEALVDAGVAVGLDAGTADTLVRQTLLGAARLLAESGEAPEQLRTNVTSPGGTTAEGIAVFEAAGLRGIVADVVSAATRRSRELGAD